MSNMKIKKLALGVGMMALIASPAYGTATLKLDDGVNPFFLVLDGGVGDVNPVTGAVTYIFSLGNWTGTVETGRTLPDIGTAILPKLSLSVSASSSAAGTLAVSFSEIGFGPLAGHFVAETALTSLAPAATVTYSTYGDTGNAIFGNDGTLAQMSNTYTASPDSDSLPAPLGGPAAAPYSLTGKIVITHTSNDHQASNASMVLTAVPDGGTTLALLGCSMLGLGTLRRKFGKH